MKRKILSTLLALCMALTLLPVQALAVAADYTTGKDTTVQKAASLLTADSGGLDGEGTADDPYLINDDADLKLFRDIVNGDNGQTQNTAACARLEADIVLNNGTFNDDGKYTPGANDKGPFPWMPIGTKDNPYTGTFDGNKHTISGLNVGNATSAGLFGYTNDATIQNMAVSGTVEGTKYAGGIAGYVKGGSITGCVNLCSVLASDSDGGDVYAGGIAGYFADGSAVKNCANLKEISVYSSGSRYAGGIAGYIAKISMSYCYNVGTVADKVGGSLCVGSIVGSGAATLIEHLCWLIGTADRPVGGGPIASNIWKCSKAEFADGTALSKLQSSDAWKKTGYVAAVDMRLPLLDWQTPDTANLIGSGKADDPYLIYTAQGLKDFRDKVEKGGTSNSIHAKLMDDIDLNDELWEPISGSTINTFDGNGKTISGLYVKNKEKAGLFGAIWDCTVKNVAVTGSVEGTTWAGGIAGYAKGSTIEGCVNLCRVSVVSESSGSVYAGGIVGELGRLEDGSTPGSIQNCANWGAISASTPNGCGTSVGGIAGKVGLDRGSIANCYSVGEVSGGEESRAIHGICDDTRTNSYYLTDTVKNDPTGFDPYRKEKEKFADGTVLRDLQNGDTSVWTETGYVAAVNMFLPLLSWQKADTFSIKTADDLKLFRDVVNGGGGSAHAQLTADIDLGSETWTPIGNDKNPYSGTFDGNGKTISGLNVNVTGEEYAGLFGYTEGATIQNMAVSGTVKGAKYAGGIVGYAKDGTIEGGSNKGSTIEGCVNLCLVSVSGSEAYAGGIVGYLTDGSAVRNCANLKAISVDGSKAYAGGIAGYMVGTNGRDPEISGCYNVGSVTGSVTGSIAGYAGSAKECRIANCRWLLGTAEGIAKGSPYIDHDNDSSDIAKTKVQFAEGTVLALLQKSDASVWTKTGYLAAAGMTVPLLDWQTADSSHKHDAKGVLGSCTCGWLPEGKGATADTPYEIKDADDLKAFRDLVNCDRLIGSESFETKARCAELMADIVLNDGTFNEDGNYTPGASGKDAETWEPINNYTGTFDGRGHTIKGLYVTPEGSMIRGLFAVVLGGTIQNVTVTGYVSGKTAVGGIVGDVQAAGNSVTIKNCVNYCTVRSTGNNDAGGIVGCLSYGTISISDCANYGTVIGNRAGGIVGDFSETSLTVKSEIHFQRCLNTGRVEGTSTSGGIAGYLDAESSLTDCFNTGAVTVTNSDALTGGIVGRFSRRTATMEYCYSVGAVTAPESAASGGLVGSLDDGTTLTATYCYWLEGTAKTAIGNPAKTPDNTSAKSKTQFADGTVLTRLVNERADSPWADKCQYFAAAGMVLPVFKGYSHTHTGGTATCKDKAVCEVCGMEYGALAPSHHTDLKHVPAKAATRRAEGNIEYWYCDGCGKYFSDQAASKEITKADTIVAKKSASSGSSGSSGSAAEKTVKSGSTGDAGIALYGVMALLSLTGGAWLTGRKRK